MFKNLVAYVAPGFVPMNVDFEKLKLLESPVGLQATTRGWLPVDGEGNMHRFSGRGAIIRFGVEEKKIPTKAFKKMLAIRLRDIEVAQGFKPGRKQQREVADVILAELLPRVIAVPKAATVWLAEGLIAVDTSSVAFAEAATNALRDALGELKIHLFETDVRPTTQMTAWALDSKNAPLTLTGDATLVYGDSRAHTVKYSNHELDGIEMYINAGARVSKLSLQVAEHSFTVDEFLTVTKIKQPDHDEAVENVDQFDADLMLAIASGELIINSLSSAFKFPEPFQVPHNDDADDLI